MRKSKFNEEQIVGIIPEADGGRLKRLAADRGGGCGKTVARRLKLNWVAPRTMGLWKASTVGFGMSAECLNRE